jgi:2-oxoglutarate dehydrogenase E1 component
MTSSIDLSAHFGPDSGYIEELFELYCSNPEQVGATWQDFFAELIAELGATNGVSDAARSKPYVNGSGGAVSQMGTAEKLSFNPEDFQVNGHGALPSGYAFEASSYFATQERVNRLVSAFRQRGHLRAKVNPLQYQEGGGAPESRYIPEDIQLDFYRFTQGQLAESFSCAHFSGKQSLQLESLIQELEQVYCGAIGFETTHILSQEKRSWLTQRIESRLVNGSYQLTDGQRRHRLQKIIEAELMESELHKKYIGHKRFSLEGGETLVPMVHTLIDVAADAGAASVVIGMSHRGRLNILHNILGKPLSELFTEFNDSTVYAASGSGDVKYHMGFKSNYKRNSGSDVRVALAPNPSHLEFVDPVVCGMVRAEQDLSESKNKNSVVPVLIHGDSAFVGQGVVPETLNMSTLDGYGVGGTIHIVVNNQVGFTTNPEEYRSTVYCTDFAKAVQAPVFHVNCEHIEAACWAVAMAVDYRMRFGSDVVLDLYCFRKYGHNEGDDPSFTQPLVYSELKSKRNAAELYAEELIARGTVSPSDVEAMRQAYRSHFDAEAELAKRPAAAFGEVCALHGKLRVPSPKTAVSMEQLEAVGKTLVEYPSHFSVHAKLHKILQKRVDGLSENGGIDWGFAEGLAFGTLVQDGKVVRLSGQDCGRGTFSQRHLMLTDVKTGHKFLPFSQLESKNDAYFEVFNSNLSETAVLGFEFGYSSIAREKAMVLWEAQFGDFANGAQVIIDQFIASSEQKWNQISDVVLLLPHGYEGAGPEHSSARLERFLQLAADGNMTIAVPSNAAQHFHLLRRHGLNEFARPLVVMTPKSLLRAAEASVSASALTSGEFSAIIESEYNSGKKPKAEHLVFCSGKVFYDVHKTLAELKNPGVRVIRLEQLYPFPEAEVAAMLERIGAVKSCSWIQEEPKNQGAWSYVEPYLREALDSEIDYIGRVGSASTATGSPKAHAAETKAFLLDLLEQVSS